MLFCSFEARYRVISGLFKCLIPRRWRHWSLSSRTLISASTRSPHIFWSKHLLNSSQKQVCFFGFDTFTNNYAVCSSLCKESQFCVCKLSTYPFHTQRSCWHCKIIYSLWTGSPFGKKIARKGTARPKACSQARSFISFMFMPLGTSYVL